MGARRSIVGLITTTAIFLLIYTLTTSPGPVLHFDSRPTYFMITVARKQGEEGTGRLQLLSRKEKEFPVPTQSTNLFSVSPLEQKLSTLFRLNMLSLKLQAAQLAAEVEDGHLRNSKRARQKREVDDCLDAEIARAPRTVLSPLTSVQDRAIQRPCAFVTYVHRVADTWDAALLMFSVQFHQSVCDTLVLVTSDVSTASRRLLALFATLVDVDPVPQGHDPHGYDLLRLWQLTAFEKVVYLPTAALALRNLTSLTQFPEWTVLLGGPLIVPVMTLVPSDQTFADMRRAQERTARSASVTQFLSNFFKRERPKLKQQHHPLQKTQATRNFSPANLHVSLPVGLVIHQQDFATFAAKGTDMFGNRPLALQYVTTTRGSRQARHDAYEEAICSWNDHEEFRHDPHFVRFVYEALMRRVIARRHTRRSFATFEEQVTPLRIVTEPYIYTEPSQIDDYAATVTLRPTFRLFGSANFSFLFPKLSDLRGMTIQQRRHLSELRSKFRVAIASDIESCHAIDPGLVTTTFFELTPRSVLRISCEICLEVESTKIQPAELRKKISSSQDNSWMSHAIAVYRRATQNDTAQLQYMGVEWEDALSHVASVRSAFV